MVQRDMISEQRLAAIIGQDRRLRDIADQLIAHASADYTVKAYWITEVTGMSPQLIATHRECGDFRALNVGGGDEKPSFRYDIISFMKWYRSCAV